MDRPGRRPPASARRVDTLTKLDYAVNGALNLAQVALYSGDLVGLLAYGREPQQRLAPGRGMIHLRALLESLAQVHAETSEADHRHAAELLLTSQGRRSLVVWMTDIAETAATPEVIECAATMATRHLVVLGIMAQTDLRQLVATRPENVHEMYRYTAALEILQPATPRPAPAPPPAARSHGPGSSPSGAFHSLDESIS